MRLFLFFFFYLFFFCEYFFFRFANLWVIHRDKQYLACTPCRFVSICLIDFNAMFRLLPFSAHTILILSSTAHNLSVCVCLWKKKHRKTFFITDIHAKSSSHDFDAMLNVFHGFNCFALVFWLLMLDNQFELWSSNASQKLSL